MPKVTIVIRSRNDAQFIERTINAVFAQKFTDFEVIDFDNNSVDGTREIIAKYPRIKMFDVPEGSYLPGKVLNEAVSKSGGEIVVFNNADSIPLDSEWLSELINPILTQNASAVFGRQIPRADAFPWIARDYSRAFGQKRFSPSFFSMASSAAPIDILKKYPFDNSIKYSEDSLWSRGLTKKGFKIVYVPTARSEHSHNYDYEAAKKRFYGEGFADAKIMGGKFSFGIFHCIRSVIGESLKDFKWLVRRGKTGMIFDAVKFRYAQKYYYRKGLRAGRFAER